MWMLLRDRQHGDCWGAWLLKQAGMILSDSPRCAAGGALSPNGVLSPRAQAQQEIQGSSQPAEDLRHGPEYEPKPASAAKSTPGTPAEAELPPMTPAEAQVRMTLYA